MRPFVVDNDGDPKKVRRALAGLKLMAALGRQAEKALRLLESGEVPSSPVQTVGRDVVNYERALVIQQVRFSKRVVPDRKTILANLRPGIVINSPKIQEVSGVNLWTFKVGVKGSVLVWYDGQLLEYEAGSPIDSLATVRIRRTGRATVQWNDSWVGRSQDFKKIQVVNPKSSELQWLLAKMYASCAIRWHDFVNLNDLPQELVATRTALPNWLMEEGLPTTWLKEIQSAVKVVEVMGV